MINTSDINSNEGFTHYFESLELFPITEIEMSIISSLPMSLISRFTEIGIIKKSCQNEIRKDGSFTNFNFYDVYGVLLIKEFGMIPFISFNEIQGMIEEVLDVFAIEIDNIIFSESVYEINLLETVAEHLSDQRDLWRCYWLLSGETFDPIHAAEHMIRIWKTGFEFACMNIYSFRAHFEVSFGDRGRICNCSSEESRTMPIRKMIP